MYIEMTTFAVPTFLIKALIILIGAAGVWFILMAIGMFIYEYSVTRAVAKQIEIDAEIDRLHK